MNGFTTGAGSYIPVVNLDDSQIPSGSQTGVTITILHAGNPADPPAGSFLVVGSLVPQGSDDLVDHWSIALFDAPVDVNTTTLYVGQNNTPFVQSNLIVALLVYPEGGAVQSTSGTASLKVNTALP
jgi:hypothetical protein